MMVDEKLSKQSEAILAKLSKERGPNRLTAEEISRIRARFVEEDSRKWAKQFIYNFVTKSAIFLAALGGIFAAFSSLKGVFKL